jgi:hypothetical protein
MMARCTGARSLHRRLGGWALVLMCTAVTAAAAAAPAAAPLPSVPADAHLQAAQRQARGHPVLQQAVRRACASSAAPTGAAAAEQALREAEADYQRERAQARPDAARLLQAVVLRGCAAYHATRLQPEVSHPVWLHTRLTIDAVRPGLTGFEVQARATTIGGTARPSRVTFSRGLHHACFVSTDAAGLGGCTMVDTHPHGDRVNGWAEAHEGPLVATYAGNVSATVVQLPAVETREFPVFSSFTTPIRTSAAIARP